jgi:hypothetical protein
MERKEHEENSNFQLGILRTDIYSHPLLTTFEVSQVVGEGERREMVRSN